VLISRASMKQQMKGNRMKKKTVQKKKKGGGIGKLASILSPAYGIMKGQGPFSSLASGIANVAGPLAGPVALLAKDKREEAKKRRMAMTAANKMPSAAMQTNRMTPMTKMMAGGPVKRKRSIDGCAIRGKTRAV